MNNIFDSEDSGIWVWIVKGALLMVTGWMTWSFLSYIMGPDKQLVAIVGLVAFEGGIVLWPHLYKNDAITPRMSQTCIVMILVSIAGIALAFIGEIMRNNAGAAELLAWLQPMMPIIVGAVVIINVAAYTYMQIISPKAQLERQKKLAQLANLQADAMRVQYDARNTINAAQARYGHDAPLTNGKDESSTDDLPLPPPSSPSSTRRAKSTQAQQPPR